MELRYSVFLSLIMILSFVVSGIAARPISGSTSEVSVLIAPDVKITSSSKVNVPVPESKVANVGSADYVVPIVDGLTSLNLEGVTHEERMLTATTQDYADPSTNDNPKYNP